MPITPLIPVSVGELVDKITILELKREYITAPSRLSNILRELAALETVWDLAVDPDLGEHARDCIRVLYTELKSINRELWHIEEFKRAAEHSGTFDEKFVEAARSVYLKNDVRAELKRAINVAAGSGLQEEKSHATVK